MDLSLDKHKFKSQETTTVHQLKWLKSNRLTITSVGDVEQLILSYTAGVNTNEMTALSHGLAVKYILTI